MSTIPNLESRLHSALPYFNLSLTEWQYSLLLSAVLSCGLMFIVPSVTVVVRWLGLDLPYPLLLSAAAVLFLYVMMAVLIRELLRATLCSFVVTSTFAANLPLNESTIAIMPGSLGPQLWLAELPLVVLVLYVALNGWFRSTPISFAELAFGGFVVWAWVSAAFGSGPRPLTAVYYAFFMTILLIIYITIGRLLTAEETTAPEILAAFVVAAASHAVFGVLEFANQESFGFSHLGENFTQYSGEVYIPLIGQMKTGLFVSGFASGGAVSIMVMAIPIALGFAYSRQGRSRLPYLGSAVFMAIIVRVSASEAGRGAMIVGLLAFLGFLFVSKGSFLLERAIEGITMVVIGATSVYVWPFSTTSTPPGSSSGSPSSSPGTTPSDPGGSTTPWFSELLQQVIPVRYLQYKGALDIAHRYPLFGLGGGNWPYVAGSYGLWIPSTETIPRPIHNIYLSTLASTGFPGLILFVLFLSTVMFQATVRLVRDGSSLRIGVWSAVIGFAVFGMLGPQLVLAPAAFPFFLIAAIAASDGKIP